MMCNDRMFTSKPGRVRSAPQAAVLAEITYRQLDHWERQGWITASYVEQLGGRRIRRYSDDDVVKLAALRHLAVSGLDVAFYGPAIGACEIPTDHVLVVATETIEVVKKNAAWTLVVEPGRWTVFDPEPVRQRCSAVPAPANEIRNDSRRTA